MKIIVSDIDGVLNSFDDYKQHIGVIQGLQTALDIVNEILTEDEEES